MIKSMTGFGRYELSENNRKISIEIKSVNHRYLDFNIKLPRKFSLFEAQIRQIFKTYAKRGKVDMYITYEDRTENKLCLKYNSELADEYMKYFHIISDQFQIPNDMRVSNIVRSPEVFTMEEQSLDEEEMWLFIHKALVGAADNFMSSRVIEGENLKTDLLQKLDAMIEHVEFIDQRFPQIISKYKKRLEEKVQELFCNTQIEESRIALEVTLFADKLCIDEELVRLKSHIASMKKDIEKGGEIGRRLDFMAQELNREANTVLSKANDQEISDRAIDLKTEIEKVREQIQNIE